MRVLALVEGPGHVCSRYRVRAFESALSRAGHSLQVEGLARGPVARLGQLAGGGRFDTVLLQRRLLPPWQLAILRRAARRLVFDFDDAVLYRDSFDPRGPHSKRRASRFARTVKSADSVIAGNDFLADCALRAGARAERVQVIPTCVDPAGYRPLPRIDDRERPGLELAWIGSASTLQGLEAERALLERLGREVPGLTLKVICDRFPSFEALRVRPVVWSEATEAAELAGADAGLGWMPDGLWSRGKCGLKVLQYGAAGLPILANPVGVHSEMVEPGVNGFLPRTPDAWIAAAQALAADPIGRRRMGQAARARVEAGYSVAAWSGAFVEALAGPLGSLSPAAIPPPKVRKVRRAARHDPAPREA